MEIVYDSGMIDNEYWHVEMLLCDHCGLDKYGDEVVDCTMVNGRCTVCGQSE